MADRLNISSTYLSDVEKGKRDSFDLDRLNQIAKILNLDEEESSIMMDLAGKQRNTVAPDLPEYILKTKGLSVALRKARDLDVKEEEWIKFIEEIEKREVGMYQYNFSKSSTGAPFITLDQIESLTENILNNYCPSALENFEAVDIEGLAEFDLGFSVEYAYLSHNGCYAGMMVFNDDQVIRTMKSLMPNVETGQWELEYLTDRANTILIDKQLDNPRDKGFRRFTLAHECGHGVIHPCVFYRDPNQLSFLMKKKSLHH